MLASAGGRTSSQVPVPVYQFADFRLDCGAFEILSNGQRLRVERKPMELLILLASREGQLVTRAEIAQRLWSSEVFVDTEHGINTAIRKLRHLLRDDPENPQFIQTVTGMGYRFIAPITPLEREETVAPADAPVPSRATPIHGNAVSRKWQNSALVVVAILAVGGLALSISRYFGSGRQPFQKIRIEMPQPTVTGNQTLAAISRDGRFVAYATGIVTFTDCYEGNREKESLWTTQLAGTAVQVIPPEEVHYTGLTFSPDGDSLYFVRCRKDTPSRISALYKVPALGGRPQRLIDDIGGTVAVSPDGKQLAFVRQSRDIPNNSELIVANNDGGAERLIARDSVGERMISPAWSPDGKTIAIANIDQEKNQSLMEVPVNGGPERFLSNHRWADIDSLVWLSKGRGLIVIGAAKAGELLQIHYVSSVTGEVSRLTNDTNDYRGLSLTADSGIMAAVQNVSASDIWVGTLTNPGKVSPISSGGRAMWPVWTPDGGVAYVAEEGTRNNLWTMQADGGNSRPLTMEPLGRTLWPRISPDGRYITSSRKLTGGWHLWRVDIDGSNPRQLTRDAHDAATDLSFSPDGKWVVFENGERGIWKVPIDGGDPILVAKRGMVTDPVVSPDGMKIAYIYWDEKTVPSHGVAIIPFEGGPPIRILDIPADAVAWAPDRQSLLYIKQENAVWNLWIQPLAGGPSREVTHFDVGSVESFDLSKDGKRLVMSRLTESSHVVLIRDSR
jgi:Tol biopolymer transport system component/DNA-binding winged helix-turn-helix (wHTH) protein